MDDHLYPIRTAPHHLVPTWRKWLANESFTMKLWHLITVNGKGIHAKSGNKVFSNKTYAQQVMERFGGDRKWPKLVGLTAEEAEAKIKEEMLGAVVHVIPPNHIITAIFRIDRVRISVDAAGKVFETPSIG
ncbi:hypothetical protein RJ639_015439 [Escallonia herrerae]|uniref:Uncharacterized protein n=1 Tax=Escallonia herrerae TaxID=1293975 RepID=A0AA89APH5_9ASTE|nr:hypothetical protein RJ639_015439 [Escallonia herrerae]